MFEKFRQMGWSETTYKWSQWQMSNIFNNEFYETLDTFIGNAKYCSVCKQQLWVWYSDGHMDYVCTNNCEPYHLGPASYVGDLPCPITDEPSHIEKKYLPILNNVPEWRLPHEQYYYRNKNFSKILKKHRYIDEPFEVSKHE